MRGTVTAAGMGLHEAAVDFAIDLRGCKNEPMLGWLEATLLCQVGVAGIDRGSHVSVIGGAAFGLSLAELLNGLEDAGAEAGFLELDVAERALIFDGGVGFDHGDAEGGVVNGIVGGWEVFEMSERK